MPTVVMVEVPGRSLGVWKWLCNMVMNQQPWSFETAWSKIVHNHDDVLRFSGPGLVEEVRSRAFGDRLG